MSDQHDEIISRLDALAGTVREVKVLAEKTNGRVTTLEARASDLEQWRTHHQSWAEASWAMVEDQRRAIEGVQEQMHDVVTACQSTPANLEQAVAAVLDQRQTTEDAAKYRALVKRFGAEPEEDLGRWSALKAGGRAVGWRIASTVVTILVTAVMAAVLSLWAVSL